MKFRREVVAQMYVALHPCGGDLRVGMRFEVHVGAMRDRRGDKVPGGFSAEQQSCDRHRGIHGWLCQRTRAVCSEFCAPTNAEFPRL